MIKVIDISNSQEVYFYPEDVGYISFDDPKSETRECQIGLRGTDYWIKVSAEQGRAILKKAKRAK